MQAPYNINRYSLRRYIRTRILPRQPSILATAAAIQREVGTNQMAVIKYQALVPSTKVLLTKVLITTYTNLMNTNTKAVLGGQNQQVSYYSQYRSETSPTNVFILI